MNIKGIDKAKILCILYNNSKPLGLGFMHYEPIDMKYEEAKKLLKTQKYFDYLKGRVMKINLDTDDLNTWLYNRDNGEGKAEKLIKTI